MDNCLVSWLIPIFNSENTLSRAFESMLGQTYQNFEIVAVYDYCEDNTLDVLNKYAKKDKRIRVYHNENKPGVAGALNYGLGLCNGKYIARMDADDYSYPERLEKQVAFMEMNPEIDILGSFCQKIIEDKNLMRLSEHPVRSEEIKCHLLFNIQAIHPTIMFRSETITRMGIEYPYCHAEDYALFASLLDKVKFYNLPEVLLDYHINTDEQLTTVIKNEIRKVNMDVSRKAIEDNLGIDTSKYPDSFFGSRVNDNSPYDIANFLRLAKEFFMEMLSANREKKVFKQYIFEDFVAKEYNSIRGVTHINSFGPARWDYVINELDRSEAKCDFSIEESFAYPEGKVIIYGTGDFASGYVPLLFNKANYEILAFCDSNPQKQGGIFLDTKVIGPHEISDYKYDFILIATPLYYCEIREMLVNKYGVSVSRIIDFRHLLDVRFFRNRFYLNIQFNHSRNERKIYLFCAPDYSNLGDHAIAYAERVFFENYFGKRICEVPMRDYKDVVEIARKNIMPKDLILITGGGFLGSLWIHSEEMVRKTISEFPNNNIVILPQTLYWGDKRRFEKQAEYTKTIYSSHKHLTICARDEVTLELMKQYYPECRIILVPDMVLSIDWGGMTKEYDKREGAIICLKEDKESVISDNQKYNIEKECREQFGSVIFTNNLYKYPRLEADNRMEALSEQLQRFSKAKICVTDRLHGMLFSVITGTPCIVLNNCNHKLKASYNWFRNLSYIQFVDDLKDLKQNMIEINNSETFIYDRKQFETYFDELLKVLKECLENE